jgi:putative membrane protein
MNTIDQNKIDQSKSDRFYLITIGVLSVAIPIVVAVLLFLPQTGKLGDFDVSFLPHFNAVLNSATAICLFIGFFYIKMKNESAHRTMMMSAFALSSIFLVSYVLYHFQAAPTRFGGEGFVRVLYYFFLITHIILAAVVVPFVLLAFYFALSKQITKHKKVVKYTFPIWLYVAVTGVIVYLMISPYYVQ